MLKPLMMLVALGATPAFAQAAWTPDDAAIQKLEHAARTMDWDFVLQKTAPGPLDDYARFYAGETVDGRHIIQGVFMSGRKGVYVLASTSQLPMILDGGCHYVSLTYDADADRLERIACNGMG